MSSPRLQCFRKMSKYHLSLMEGEVSVPVPATEGKGTERCPFCRWEHEAHGCRRPYPRSSKEG